MRRETPAGGGEGAAEAEPPLPRRAPQPAVTHLSGPTGVGSAGRPERGLPQEHTGPRAVGTGGSVLARSPAPLPPPPAPCLPSDTNLAAPNLRSSLPTLGAIRVACISEALPPPLTQPRTYRRCAVCQSLAVSLQS